MDVIVQNPPNTLWGSNVAAIDVLLNFIMFVFEGDPVSTFMNILEAVLDRSECRDGFDVCMTVIFRR